MAQAKSGDRVKVHYRGKLDDGTVFDESFGKEPLEFVLGAEQIIPGFDEAVVGMEVGETKTVVVPPEKAYGEHRDDMVVEFPKSGLPEDLNPQVGQQLQMQQNGQTFIVTVTDISDDTITLDANHPLAGRNLTFEITLVEIV